MRGHLGATVFIHKVLACSFVAGTPSVAISVSLSQPRGHVCCVVKEMSVFASQLKMCDSQGPWLRPPAGLIANGSAEKARALSPPFFACLLLGASGFK